VDDRAPCTTCRTPSLGLSFFLPRLGVSRAPDQGDHRWLLAAQIGRIERMRSPIVDSQNPPATPDPALAVRVIGILTVAWCAGFAVVNVVFELTDRFSAGPYAEYAGGITVMNWFVVGLKALGAAVALRSVADRYRWPSPTTVAVLLWGAFATVGLYAAGSVAQWIAMASGVTSHGSDLRAADVAYVLLFVAAALGFGTLATSFSRRHRTGPWCALIGVLGAPVVLLLVLVIAPAILVGLGIMPGVR
jgi:hypothetical protein